MPEKKKTIKQIDIYELISSKSKVKILSAILDGPLSVNKIVNATKIEQTNVSHTLNSLLGLRVVNQKVDGKTHIYSINNEFRPYLKKLLNDIRKNEDMLKKIGIITAITLISLRLIPTGDISTIINSSYFLIQSNSAHLSSIFA
ncbi:MAG: ArsR/SmtB family transcription factor [Candidatus Micrarchaeia archaeon]